MKWFTVHHVVDLKRSVCLNSSLISSKKNWFSSAKNCCYSFLSSSKKNLDSTFRTGWLSVIRSGAMHTVHSYYMALCGRGGDHPDWECSLGAVADAGEVACVGDGCCSRGIQMLLMWSPGSCGTVSWRWISMASLTMRVFQLLMEVMSWVSSHMMRWTVNHFIIPTTPCKPQPSRNIWNKTLWK